jgi:hypothetical protein
MQEEKPSKLKKKMKKRKKMKMMVETEEMMIIEGYLARD